MTLLERDPNAPSAWMGEMPVTSRYTFGLAGERFFRTIKEEGRILGTRCHRCEHIYVPATIFCERCLGELDEWVDVGIDGEVHTYTLLYENPDGTRQDRPELVAFVRLGDGGLVHRLGEVEPEAVFIGLPVQAVFKPASERKGSILDIVHFRPLDAEDDHK
jgi:uncharacterized OB-fold protein